MDIGTRSRDLYFLPRELLDRQPLALAPRNIAEMDETENDWRSQDVFAIFSTRSSLEKGGRSLPVCTRSSIDEIVMCG